MVTWSMPSVCPHRAALASVAVLALLTSTALAVPATDFLVYGKGTVSLASQNWEGVFIGPGSVMYGNVGSMGDIQTNGVATINGDVDTNSQTIFSAGTTVNGSVAINTATVVTLPTPTVFVSGGANQGGAFNNGSLTLAPGSYGVLFGGGGWDLNLTSGDYFFDAIHFGNSTDINIDLSGGPINIYVTGELFFGSGADVHLTQGGDASMIYWETHLAGDLNAFRAGGGSDWLGTVYAPYGGIHFGSGSGPTTFQGHFWSGWDGGASHERSIYIEHGVTGTMPPTPPNGQNPPPAVPEPTTIALSLLGLGLGLTALRRRA